MNKQKISVWLVNGDIMQPTRLSLSKANQTMSTSGMLSYTTK